MSKQKNGAALPGALPPVLQAIVDQVAAGKDPEAPGEDASRFPLLWEMLRPRLLPELDPKPGTVPRIVRREPMLLLTHQGGGWRVSITDKVLRFSASLTLRSLGDGFPALEEAIGAGKCQVSEPRKRKG